MDCLLSVSLEARKRLFEHNLLKMQKKVFSRAEFFFFFSIIASQAAVAMAVAV
jgi:hypothetical protein